MVGIDKPTVVITSNIYKLCHMLYILNLYSDLCQLLLSKTGNIVQEVYICLNMEFHLFNLFRYLKGKSDLSFIITQGCLLKKCRIKDKNCTLLRQRNHLR